MLAPPTLFGVYVASKHLLIRVLAGPTNMLLGLMFSTFWLMLDRPWAWLPGGAQGPGKAQFLFHNLPDFLLGLWVWLFNRAGLNITLLDQFCFLDVSFNQNRVQSRFAHAPTVAPAQHPPPPQVQPWGQIYEVGAPLRSKSSPWTSVSWQGVDTMSHFLRGLVRDKEGKENN